jgi:hypothetical protein
MSCPAGIIKPQQQLLKRRRRDYSQSSIYLPNNRVKRGRTHVNTFHVNAKHEVLFSSFSSLSSNTSSSTSSSPSSIKSLMSEDESDNVKHHHHHHSTTTTTNNNNNTNNNKNYYNNKSHGVRFNVETVPEPLLQHKHKQALSRKTYLQYLTTMNRNIKEGSQLEAVSFHDGINFDGDNNVDNGISNDGIMDSGNGIHDKDSKLKLVAVGGNSFLIACVTAFAQHLPLGLSPDHIWNLITYAFAKHVDIHADELRSQVVVNHNKEDENENENENEKEKGSMESEIKVKKLIMNTPDSFHMSTGNNNPDTGASDKEWEQIVFPQFSKQIKENIHPESYSLLTEQFTTTTVASNMTNEIALISTMKNYFSYGMRTCCGIPNITLKGKEEDWVSLRHRTEALQKYMKKDFANYWMPLLLPILDQFVESYRANVNHSFWQSMVKLRNSGGGSGSYSFISGWMQIFFPYLASGQLNVNLRPWQDMYFNGPEPGNFPSIICTAPIEWNYHGTNHTLDLNAGINAVSQREEDGMLCPEIGWYVTHSNSSEKKDDNSHKNS